MNIVGRHPNGGELKAQQWDSPGTLVAKAKLLEFHARYLWPLHRHLVKRHLARRCRRCVISENCFPLDEQGVCTECRRYDVERAGSDDLARLDALDHELTALFRTTEGGGRLGYDALVMLSGGKDSALLAHELRMRFPGLRLLALTIDTGFMSPVALANARHVATKLNIDSVVVRLRLSMLQKSFRYACTHLPPGKGCFDVVDRMDADIGYDLACSLAATHRIPLVVSGLSWAQVERLFGARSFELPQALLASKREETIGVKLDTLYSTDERVWWWDPARYPPQESPRVIHPFYVWRLSEQEIRRRVIELGLIRKGNDNPLVTNNALIPVMVLVDYRHLGYASYEPEFASMVRQAKADPKYWRNMFEMFEYSARTGWLLDADVGRVLGRLGLSRRDVGLDKE